MITLCTHLQSSVHVETPAVLFCDNNTQHDKDLPPPPAAISDLRWVTGLNISEPKVCQSIWSPNMKCVRACARVRACACACVCVCVKVLLEDRGAYCTLLKRHLF